MGVCCSKSSAQIVPNVRNRTSNKIADNDEDENWDQYDTLKLSEDEVEQSEEETDDVINSSVSDGSKSVDMLLDDVTPKSKITPPNNENTHQQHCDRLLVAIKAYIIMECKANSFINDIGNIIFIYIFGFCVFVVR
eukprot:147535_1